MPCPVCSSNSLSDAAARLTSELIGLAQEVRDISSRLRHKTGTDPETADMLDELARRMATDVTQAVPRIGEFD